MGKCFSRDQPEQIHGNSFNEFFYLCRELKYLIRVTPDSISKFKYDKLIKIRSDSGIGYLSDGRIIIGGGTDSSGCLTNKAYLLDPAKEKVTVLPDMPVSTKEGTFFHYKEFAYYLGGIQDSDDEILAQEQTAPILRYFLLTGQWEIFDEDNKKNLQGHNLKFFEDPDKIDDYYEGGAKKGLHYKNILYPGMFMIGSKVYFINAQRIDSRGILKMMDSVFSVDLEQIELGIQVESFKSPLNSFRPICGSYSKTAFIAGGLKYSSKKSNKDSYIVDFNQSPPKFTLIQGLKINLDDTYPIIGNHSSFVSINFPFFAIYDQIHQAWFQFEIEQLHIHRSKIKYQTPVMQLEKIEKADKIIKTKTNFKVEGLSSRSSSQIQKYSDDEYTAEKDSLHIKLPPGLVIEQSDKDDENVDNLNSDHFSNSSNTFSVEKRIDLPEALKVVSRSSSSSIKDEKYFQAKESLKNMPNAEIMPVKDFGLKNILSPDQGGNLEKFFVSKHTIPQFSDSDSIVVSQVRKSSESESESFQEEEFSIKEIESYNDKNEKPADLPISQRLAPIISNFIPKKKHLNNYSYSQESSSESFIYDEDSNGESSSSDSRV